MADISAWSPVDESNTAAPPHGWPENMQNSAVNNSARALMGGVRRWYDTVTAQLASLTTSVANAMPISGGIFTGPITAPSIHSNSTVSASTNIAASGAITAAGNISGATITGNLLQSNGNIAAAGDISCNDLTGTGVITGAALSSTGTITATGAVYGAFLSSSGAASVATNLDVGGATSLHGTLGVTGNITASASLSVGGNITSGNIDAVGVISTPYLKSNAAHLAGTLLTWGGSNHVNFRWNGASLLYRIDETIEGPVTTAVGDTIEHTIATTEMLGALRDMVETLTGRVAELEAMTHAR